LGAMEGAGAAVGAAKISCARTDAQTPRKNDAAIKRTAAKDFMMGRA
jgi:hypothetical protein